MNINLSEEAKKNAQEMASKLGMSVDDFVNVTLENWLIEKTESAYPPDAVIEFHAAQDPDCAPVLSEEEIRKNYKFVGSFDEFLKNENL